MAKRVLANVALGIVLFSVGAVCGYFASRALAASYTNERIAALEAEHDRIVTDLESSITALTGLEQAASERASSLQKRIAVLEIGIAAAIAGIDGIEGRLSRVADYNIAIASDLDIVELAIRELENRERSKPP